MELSPTDISILTHSPLFAGLSDGSLAGALRLFGGHTARYKKGELIHKPWSRMTEFGLVLSGTVQACADDFDGNRMIMADVQPGVTFGEALCFLEIADSPVYISASEDAEILWLSAARLYESSDHAMQKRFTALLASRTLAMNDRIQILSKLSIREKLMVYFSERAASAGSNTFLIPFNREDMATYIGCDRASLSRELARLKKEGVIDYQKNAFKLFINAES